jgi:tape measure domain-containing protein
MENINGALGFAATLDIDDFNVSAEAMDRHIRQVSTNIQMEAEDMEQSILDFAQKGAMYIQAYLVGQGMTGLLQSIVQVRGQFQQLEIAFGTMLGSEQKAKDLMDQMITTAAKTPFDLAGIAGGAKQLLAYGTAADKVNDTLVRLGNIAAGLSIPLNDIVYLYGTTMVQGRLYAQDVRQFTGRGIPLVKELAKMYGVTAEEINSMVSAGKIGFPEVEKVLNGMTDAGGQFYNLMEKQSASLTGMLSNLSDAWDSMLNDIGRANQEVFADAINGASYLVEHYQAILDILEAVAVSYGTVRAAIMLNTLATKGYTGVALIDNTARQAKLALLKAEAVATGQVAAQQRTMTAANEAYVASLEAELTAEEIAEVKKRLRIATIQSLLTAQQQEYLSNLGLTASSQGYEAAALQVLTVEQQQAVQKLDLSSKSAIYRAALDQEVAAKHSATAATREKAAAELEAMRTEVSAAARRMETAKQTAVSAMQKAEAARYELYWVRQSGDASAIATAQKKLEGAEDNAAIARKNALAASTDFYTKKKTLEITATRTSTAASAADTTAKGAQTVATNVLSVATGRLTAMMRTLWATMKANPIGWLVTILGLAVSAFTMFRKEEDEAKTVMGDFQETTQKEIDKLNLLYAVLNNTEKGTKTHKETIEKINAICREYNKTLLDENDTLEDQRKKYEEVKKAIQETTAEKIRAKYVEQAMQKATDDHAESLKRLKEAAEEATHKEFAGYQQNYTARGSSGTVETYRQVASKNIREASDAMWEIVESMAQDASRKLVGLTDDAYTNTYNEIINNITDAIQKGTNASGAEIQAFKPALQSYLDEYVNTAQTAQSEIAKIDREIGSFMAPKDPTPVVESVNYVEMSFDDLDKKVKANQDEIDKLNGMIVNPQTDASQIDDLKKKLQECLGLQAQLNGAITTKMNDLNTDSGIQDRIKQLREMISTEQYGSEQRKKHIKELQQLQSKLQQNSPTQPKSKAGSNNQEQNANQLEEKQLEAQRKLEEARIAVMEEGYAKRKATLDLQHQRELDRIAKEEKELERARKKADPKSGGLTDEEKRSFEERRKLANQSYDQESIRLFDGEIEYKKKQYEAYFSWVRNVGQDVANAHFKDLIADGSSFISWVNSQIAQLEAKRQSQPQDFTDGDANALNALRNQLDELTGQKSSMDKFKESLTQNIRQAQTLAQKLQAVAEMRDRLARGEFHLNTDENAAANLSLNQQESDLNQQVTEEVLNNYKTFEEQKLEITQQYQLLRNEAEKLGLSERVAMINQGEAEALSALNAQMLMQTESWKNLFADLDSLTVEQIETLIRDIQDKMSTADLKLNPADMKAVLDKLDEAKKKVLDTNPFKALGNALSEVFKKQQDGSKKTSKQIKTDWKNLGDATKACFDFVDDAIDSCSVLGDMLGDTGKSVISTLSGIATAGVAMSEAIATAEKGSVILAAISIALQAINFIAGLFNNDDEIEEHIQSIQREVDALGSALNRLQNAYEHTYWVFNDEEEAAYRRRLNAIQDQIKALEAEADLARQMWQFSKYAELTKQIKDLRYELEKAQRTGDMFDLMQLQTENLRKQQVLIREQIESEKDKKDTDWDKISQWEEKIKDIDTQIQDIERSMMETLAGTDVKTAIDEFADALVEAYDQGIDRAEALGKKTKEVLRNAVIEALKRQFLAKGINDAVEYLGSAMQDNTLTDQERAHFEAMVNQAGNLFNNALDGIGDWIKNAEEKTADPLTGAVQGMSEETGGIVAGRMNAVVINQSEQLEMTRQLLLFQAAISTNTANTVEELKTIKGMFQTLISSGNPLLAQGIS